MSDATKIGSVVFPFGGVSGPAGPAGPPGPPGGLLAIAFETLDFVAAINTHYEVDATLGQVDVTLPTPVGVAGEIMTFAKADASVNIVRVNGLINNAAFYDISFQNSAMSVRSTGVVWRIV